MNANAINGIEMRMRLCYTETKNIRRIIMANSHDTDFTSIMNFVDEVELFEHIKHALAKALNKTHLYKDITADNLGLDENSRFLYYEQCLDGRKYVHLDMQATVQQSLSSSLIQIKVTPYNIGFSFPFTILYAQDRELTKSLFDYMKTKFPNCGYEEEYNRYHELLNNKRKNNEDCLNAIEQESF